jgi:hypothetical protein
MGNPIIILTFSCKKKPQSFNGYDILLIMGQSNNHNGYAEQHAPQSDNIKQLGRYDDHSYKIIPAEERLQHHDIQENKSGFVMTFAKLYEQNLLKSNRKTLIIPCAKSGSSFKENLWRKNDKIYADAVDRVLFAKSENKNNKLISILWHQGESDVKNINYQKDFDQFIDDFRKDIKAPHKPFICGGMVPFWAKQTTKRIQQQNIIKDTPSRKTNVGYANPDLPFTIEKIDNAKTQLIIGMTV